MSNNNDIAPLMAFSDIPAALGLLSRVPVSVDTERATARGAKAAWAYPIAGLIIGFVACAIAQITLALGVPTPLVAGLTLATLVIITGAMHEDGLADTLDGLWGGWDKDHRLKIMKDSYIGVYGVAGLALSLALRWQALTIAIQHDMLWPTVLVTACLSRAVMVPVMARLPHAREYGLSHSVGRPDIKTAQIAVAIAAVIAIFAFGWPALWLLTIAALAPLVCAAIATAKIEGQTGDILGATQQVTEIALLLTIATLL